MHEASAIEAVVKIVDLEAKKLGDAAKVSGVRLVVGEGTGHMEASLAFYFKVHAKGTRAEGAELTIQYVKPKLRCSGCGELFERRRFSFDCPSCGAPGVLTKIGSEFYVDSIEVENSTMPQAV